jgi:hypothetical protein
MLICMCTISLLAFDHRKELRNKNALAAESGARTMKAAVHRAWRSTGKHATNENERFYEGCGPTSKSDRDVDRFIYRSTRH